MNKSDTNQIYKKLLGIASYITVTIINNIMTYIIRKLVNYERHSSYTDQNLSFATKLSLIYFINSAFIPFLILLISNGSMEEKDDLYWNLESIFIGNMIITPSFFLINIWLIIRNYKRKIINKTNKKLT